MDDEAPAGASGYVRKLLLALLAVAAAWLVLHWLHLFLLVFAAVLVAELLRALSEPLSRWTGLGEGWALAAAILGVVLILAGAVYFIGARVSDQIVQLWNALPGAWTAAKQQIAASPAGADVLSQLDGLAGGADLRAVATRVIEVTRVGVTSAAEVLLVVIAGVYLAAQPRLYREGALSLVPARARPRIAQILSEAGAALRKWLLGTALAMLCMGLLVGLGTALLGLPAPLALGLMAGVAEFVPIVGAIVSAVPGILLAATLGLDMALFTLAFYVFAHQVEGQLLIPLIHRRIVSVPPAVTLFSVLGFSMLFGPLGIVLATPLAVLCLVAVLNLQGRSAAGPGAGGRR